MRLSTGSPGPFKLFVSASAVGNLNRVKEGLRNPTVDPNEALSGKNALMRAAEEGHVAVVKLLLADNRIKPNMQTTGGKTALLLAAEENKRKVVEALLQDERVDPNIADKHGWTALMYASFQGHEEVVAKLLSHPEIDAAIQSDDDWTALTLARASGYTGIADLLLLFPEIHLFDTTQVYKTTRNSGNGTNAVTWQNISGPKYYLLSNLLPNKKTRAVYSGTTILKLLGKSPVTRLPFRVPENVGRLPAKKRKR